MYHVVTKKHVKNFCLLFFNKLSFLASTQNQKFFIIKLINFNRESSKHDEYRWISIYA